MLAAIWGTGVFGKLQSAGGFVPPGSQSQQEANLAARSFGPGGGDVVLLYTSASADRPVTRLQGGRDQPRWRGCLAAGSSLRRPTGPPARQRSSARTAGSRTRCWSSPAAATRRKIKSFDAIQRDLSAPGLTVQAGGQIPTEAAINKEVTSDIGRAEGISMPVLLVLLLVIFGSLAAASLPLAIGGIGIIGSFAALRLLTLATPVSIYSVNITTILGLGLAIDYGLFMVGRFREELRRQAQRGGCAGQDRGDGRPHGRGVRASPWRWRWPACCSSLRCSCARWATAASPRFLSTCSPR